MTSSDEWISKIFQNIKRQYRLICIYKKIFPRKKIQQNSDGHCSIEDARTCMHLVQLKITKGRVELYVELMASLSVTRQQLLRKKIDLHLRLFLGPDFGLDDVRDEIR